MGSFPERSDSYKMKIWAYHLAKVIVRSMYRKFNRILVWELCKLTVILMNMTPFSFLPNSCISRIIQGFLHHKIWSLLMNGEDSWASLIQNTIQPPIQKKVHWLADSGALLCLINFELNNIVGRFLYLSSILFSIFSASCKQELALVFTFKMVVYNS